MFEIFKYHIGDPFRVREIYYLILFTGLYFLDGTEITYSQETEVVFLCPMVFDKYPLDKQLCKFQVI